MVRKNKRKKRIKRKKKIAEVRSKEDSYWNHFERKKKSAYLIALSSTDNMDIESIWPIPYYTPCIACGKGQFVTDRRTNPCAQTLRGEKARLTKSG